VFGLRVQRIVNPIVPSPLDIKFPSQQRYTAPIEGALLLVTSGERRVLDPRLPTYHPLRFLMPAEDRRALEHEMGLEHDGDVATPSVWDRKPFLPSRVSRAKSGQTSEALGAEPLLWNLAELMDTRLWRDTTVQSTEEHWLSSNVEVKVTNHTMVSLCLRTTRLATHVTDVLTDPVKHTTRCRDRQLWRTFPPLREADAPTSSIQSRACRGR
jgi:hypothetical protein